MDAIAFVFCLNYLLEHPEHEALFVSLCFAQNHHAPAAIFTPIANFLRENPEERDNFLARYYGAKTAAAGGNVPMDVASVSGSEEEDGVGGEEDDEDEDMNEEHDVMEEDEEQEKINYIEAGIRENHTLRDFTTAQLHYIMEHPSGYKRFTKTLEMSKKLRHDLLQKIWRMKNRAKCALYTARQKVRIEAARRALQQNA